MAKVLIVEDNPANMTLAIFLLQSAGHMVLSAADAEAGLTLARDEQPDLILMDIQLPGMDGLDALSGIPGHHRGPLAQTMNPTPNLADHTGRILIVDDERHNRQLLEVMSGYTEQSAAHKAGIDRDLLFLQKPFTTAELVRHVREALDR